MNVRKLETEEPGMTRFLYEEAFPEDSQAFTDYYYTEKTKNNQIYVLEEEGKICSMAHLNPYTLSVNGSRKETHYIVALYVQIPYENHMAHRFPLPPASGK